MSWNLEVKIWEESAPGIGKGTCKGPEVGTCLACRCDSQDTQVAGAGQEKQRCWESPWGLRAVGWRLMAPGCRTAGVKNQDSWAPRLLPNTPAFRLVPCSIFQTLELGPGAPRRPSIKVPGEALRFLLLWLRKGVQRGSAVVMRPHSERGPRPVSIPVGPRCRPRPVAPSTAPAPAPMSHVPSQAGVGGAAPPPRCR